MKKEKVELLRFENDVLSIRVTGYGKPDERIGRYLSRIGISDRNADAAKWDYAATSSGRWTINGEDKGVARSIRALPVLFETEYNLRCKFNADLNVRDCRLLHEMDSVTKSFEFGDDILSGGFDFVNAPGKFKFEIAYDVGAETRTFRMEWVIASEKMDVKTDQKEIVKTIEKAMPGIVHAFLSKSKGKGGLVEKKKDDAAIWFEIFTSVADEYKKACEMIIRRPHLKYEGRAQYLRADRIRRWTPGLVNRYRSMDSDLRERSLFRTERIEPVVDTMENRFVKFTLHDLSEKLNDFAVLCKSKQGRVAEAFVEAKMDEVSAELSRLEHHPFFHTVGRFCGFRQESLALQRKPGYSKILAAWVALQQSLDATKDGIDIGEMEIWRLYEFWCFLSMADYLEHAKGLGTPEGKIDAAKNYFDLFRDPEDHEDTGEYLSKMSYVFTPQGMDRRIQLLYQQNYPERDNISSYSNLYEQKPDIMLVIETTDAVGRVVDSYSYLFDAKYRIETKDQVDTQGIVHKGLDAAPKEPINDMHRYRDAILYRAEKSTGRELTRQVIGAYVLYPGRPNTANDQRSFDYTKYIQEENIGAIPMLPGDQGLAAMHAFIDKVLAWNGPEQHLDGDIPTLGTSVVVGVGFSEKSILPIRLGSSDKYSSRITKDELGAKKIVLTSHELEGFALNKVRFVRFVQTGCADVLIEVSYSRSGGLGKEIFRVMSE